MTEPRRDEPTLMHGQHRNRFYWIVGGIALGLGMIGGLIFAPDAFPVWRKLAAGGMFGLWCGFCVFAWHLLFYNTVKE